jgi:hypothetical protein
MTPTYENPIALLRQLKGAPLSVLLALSILRQPTSEQMLSRVTGYSEKVIRDAAHYLQEISLVGRNARFSGWVILTDVFQLPLMPGDSDRPDPAKRCHQIADRYYLPVDDSSTSSSLNGRDNEVLLENRRRRRQSNGNIYRSRPDQPVQPGHPDHPVRSDHPVPPVQLSTYQQNCLNLLNHHFIGYPKDQYLITLPHVNLTYLIGHISERIRQYEYARENGVVFKYTIGTMIYKIEQNDRRPKTMIEHDHYPTYEAPEKLMALEDRARVELIDWSDYWSDPVS